MAACSSVLGFCTVLLLLCIAALVQPALGGTVSTLLSPHIRDKWGYTRNPKLHGLSLIDSPWGSVAAVSFTGLDNVGMFWLHNSSLELISQPRNMSCRMMNGSYVHTDAIHYGQGVEFLDGFNMLIGQSMPSPSMVHVSTHSPHIPFTKSTANESMVVGSGCDFSQNRMPTAPTTNLQSQVYPVDYTLYVPHRQLVLFSQYTAIGFLHNSTMGVYFGELGRYGNFNDGQNTGSVPRLNATTSFPGQMAYFGDRLFFVETGMKQVREVDMNTGLAKVVVGDMHPQLYSYSQMLAYAAECVPTSPCLAQNLSFATPHALALFHDPTTNNLVMFIGDRTQAVIYRVDWAGQANSTGYIIAGSMLNAGVMNGPFSTAQFFSITQFATLWSDPQSLYVADGQLRALRFSDTNSSSYSQLVPATRIPTQLCDVFKYCNGNAISASGIPAVGCTCNCKPGYNGTFCENRHITDSHSVSRSESLLPQATTVAPGTPTTVGPTVLPGPTNVPPAPMTSLPNGSPCGDSLSCGSSSCKAGRCCATADSNCVSCGASGDCTACVAGYERNPMSGVCEVIDPKVVVSLLPEEPVELGSRWSFSTDAILTVSNGAILTTTGRVVFEVTSAVPTIVTVSNPSDCGVTGLNGACNVQRSASGKLQLGNVTVNVNVPRYFRGVLSIFFNATAEGGSTANYARVVMDFATRTWSTQEGADALLPLTQSPNAGPITPVPNRSPPSNNAPSRAELMGKSIFGDTDDGTGGVHFVVWTTVAYGVLIGFGQLLALARAGVPIAGYPEDEPVWKHVLHHHIWASVLVPCHRQCAPIHTTILYLGVLMSYLVSLALMDVTSAWGTASRVALIAGISSLFMAFPRVLLSYHFWAFSKPMPTAFGATTLGPAAVAARRTKTKLDIMEAQKSRGATSTLKSLQDLDNIEFNDVEIEGDFEATQEREEQQEKQDQRPHQEDVVVLYGDAERRSQSQAEDEPQVDSVEAAARCSPSEDPASCGAKQHDEALPPVQVNGISFASVEQAMISPNGQIDDVENEGDLEDLVPISVKKFRRAGYGLSALLALLLAVLVLYMSAGWAPEDRRLFWHSQFATFATSFVFTEFLVLLLTLTFRYISGNSSEERSTLLDTIRQWHPYDGQLEPQL